MYEARARNGARVGPENKKGKWRASVDAEQVRTRAHWWPGGKRVRALGHKCTSITSIKVERKGVLCAGHFIIRLFLGETQFNYQFEINLT